MLQFSSPPHLQQRDQPEKALIQHFTCQYQQRTCCFQAFPTSSCKHGPSLLLYSPSEPELVHTITTHLTQPFSKHCVSFHFSLRKGEMGKSVGRRLLRVLGHEGHLRLRVLFFFCLFVSVRNINTRDQTTARHGQPQRSHAPIILTFFWGVGGGGVFWSYIDMFTSMFFRTITCLQCRRNILWSMISCKSQSLWGFICNRL